MLEATERLSCPRAIRLRDKRRHCAQLAKEADQLTERRCSEQERWIARELYEQL